MDILIQHINEDQVLAEAAEMAIKDAYPELLEEHKLETLGRPEIIITKIKSESSLEFKIKVGVKPEIKLPNYKKIAEDIIAAETQPETSQEEIDKVIQELRQLRAAQAPGQKNDKKEDLPELTDEFVKTLGDFENVEDFKNKLSENIKLEKKAAQKKERREKIAEALGAKSKMSLPERVLESEVETLQASLRADLERAQVSLEDYLKKTNKTEKQLREEQRDYAERQLRTRFILEEIAKAEKITADPEELGAELSYLRKQYPEADPGRLEAYAEMLLKNEGVLKFLEGEADSLNVNSEAKDPEPKK